MSKVKKSAVVRLDEEAVNSMSVMLMELLKEDQYLKINNSKLVSFVLTDFHTKHFERAKPRLLMAHQDKKRCLRDKIEGLELEELDAAIRFLEKMKKTENALEKSQKS